ncbi:hypothetical protein [Oceaniglobus roseus]|uniref:hypothetical protein n=1 Tax=Oceaniglobus roseus TaxID=1737570 RepID=UPI000C7F2FC7|nr:hypothetical protein [Kandeliimicrobium roseum]
MSAAVSVFFITEGAHLTAQGLLLASSLQAHNPGRYRLIAYCPDRPGAPPMPEAAREAFSRLGCDLRALQIDDAAWKKPYPHGNKLFACAAPRETEGHVFLDTDMVCVAPLDLETRLHPGALSVVPEGTPSWGKKNDRWDRVYAHFDLPMPADRVRLTRKKRIEFLPYFNAGFVGFHSDFKAEKSFPQLWIDTAREIDWNVKVALKRPWLDQIALPVTLKRFGLAYEVLPDAYNFSISDRAFEPDANPLILHYHSFRYGPLWPQFRAEMQRMKDTLGPARMAALEPLYKDYWDHPDAAA